MSCLVKEGFRYLLAGAPHVSVAGGLLIDRLLQVKVTHDGSGAQVEETAYSIGDGGIGQPVAGSAESVDKEADGLRYADGITDLHQHLPRYPCGYHVLGYPAGCIRCRAVHLGGVFARESTAAVRAATAVGIHDNLASGQPRVAVGTADDELPRRVDQQFVVAFEQRGIACIAGGDARKEDTADVVAYLFLRGFWVMLCGDDDGVNAHGFALLVVLDSNLALGIGTEIGHLLALFTDARKGEDEGVRKVEGEGHVVLGLVGCISEHHALVARSLLAGVLRALPVHAAGDVGTLLVEGGEDAATLRFELVCRLGVTDVRNGLPRNALHVHIVAACNLARHDDLPRGDKRFARHVGVRVLCKEVVEDGVTDLVRHFVGVSFRHRFAGK